MPSLTELVTPPEALRTFSIGDLTKSVPQAKPPESDQPWSDIAETAAGLGKRVYQAGSKVAALAAKDPRRFLGQTALSGVKIAGGGAIGVVDMLADGISSAAEAIVDVVGSDKPGDIFDRVDIRMKDKQEQGGFWTKTVGDLTARIADINGAVTKQKKQESLDFDAMVEGGVPSPTGAPSPSKTPSYGKQVDQALENLAALIPTGITAAGDIQERGAHGLMKAAGLGGTPADVKIASFLGAITQGTLTLLGIAPNVAGGIARKIAKAKLKAFAAENPLGANKVADHVQEHAPDVADTLRAAAADARSGALTPEKAGRASAEQDIVDAEFENAKRLEGPQGKLPPPQGKLPGPAAALPAPETPPSGGPRSTAPTAPQLPPSVVPLTVVPTTSSRLTTDQAGALVRDSVRDLTESLGRKAPTVSEAKAPWIGMHEHKLSNRMKELHTRMIPMWEAAAQVKGPQSGHALLDKMLETAKQDSERAPYLPELLQHLRDMVEDIPVILQQGTLRTAAQVYKDGTAGLYVHASGPDPAYIVLKVDVPHTTETFIHELVHAATIPWLKANSVHPVAMELERLFSQAGVLIPRVMRKMSQMGEVFGYDPNTKYDWASPVGGVTYGLSKRPHEVAPFEFVAESIANPSFQRALLWVYKSDDGKILRKLNNVNNKIADQLAEMVGYTTPEAKVFIQNIWDVIGRIMELNKSMRKGPATGGTSAREGEDITQMNMGIHPRQAIAKLRELPAYAAAEAKLARYYEEVIRKINPEALSGEAKSAGAIIAKNVAEEAQRTSSFFHRAAARRTYWNKHLGEARDFIRVFEKGERFADPTVQAMADAYREWNREIFEGDRRVGVHYDARNNYLYHVYEDGELLDEILQREYGKKWSDPAFTKDRGFDLYEQAAKKINPKTGKPFKPLYQNPEDIMLARQHASDIARMQMGILEDLSKYGLARKVPPKGGSAPNYLHVTRRAPSGDMYYVHAHAAQILHNAFDSYSLWSAKNAVGDAYRGLMGLKNFIVPIRLALSLFHPLHVMTIDMAAGMTRELKGVLSGTTSPGKFVAGMAKAMGPSTMGSLKDLTGSRLLRVFQGKIPDEEFTPADRAALLYMAEGGLIPEMASQYKLKAMDKFKEAVERGQVTKGVLRLAPAAMGWLQKPIFENWIPSLKIASYLKDVEMAFKTDPSLIQDPLRRMKALRAIAKSVDNRYGEMAYNTLFWDRLIKDAAVGTTLSLGWQLGFIREFGGGTLDLVGAGGKPPGPGGIKGKIGRGDFDRPLFVGLYVTGSLILGGLMQYLMTGKKPDKLDDLVYPQVGENPDGTPQRVNTMYYTREFGSFLKHYQNAGLVESLSEIAQSKGSGMVGMVGEVWTGKNSFGEEIRDPNAPPFQKVLQTVEHELKGLEPISVMQAGETAKSRALAFAGFTPAPKYATETATEGAIRTTFQRYNSKTQTAYDKAEKSAEVRKLRELRAAGKDEEAAQLFSDIAEKYSLTPKDERSLSKSLDEPPGASYLRMFSELDWHHQKRILDKMTPDEREVYLKHANKAHLRYHYEAPEEVE